MAKTLWTWPNRRISLIGGAWREQRVLSGGPGDHIAEDLLVTVGRRDELNPHIVVNAGRRVACIVDPDNLA